MYWYWESWSRATIVSPFAGLLCIRIGLMVLSSWIWRVTWVQMSSEVGGKRGRLGERCRRAAVGVLAGEPLETEEEAESERASVSPATSVTTCPEMAEEEGVMVLLWWKGFAIL